MHNYTTLQLFMKLESDLNKITLKINDINKQQLTKFKMNCLG